jgi:hypothetical protein
MIPVKLARQGYKILDLGAPGAETEISVVLVYDSVLRCLDNKP